ncbi:hypothetical protein GCM10020331_093800 [Ectobacillus funiculus]
MNVTKEEFKKSILQCEIRHPMKNGEVSYLNSQHTPKLTSAEIAALWTQYVNETAGICFHKHMMEHIEDKDIQDVFFEYAMSLSSKHVEEIKVFF